MCHQVSWKVNVLHCLSSNNFSYVDKLRLNVPDQSIAYLFGVSQSVISIKFKKWINIMYVNLPSLIVWLRREEVLKTMFEMFKK